MTLPDFPEGTTILTIAFWPKRPDGIIEYSIHGEGIHDSVWLENCATADTIEKSIGQTLLICKKRAET